MKIWEVFLGLSILKMFEPLQKSEEKERRAKHRERMCDRGENLDKGSWVYNKRSDMLDFAPAQKNPHYLTVDEESKRNLTTVTISKKPHSLESNRYDYPWEAERACERYSPKPGRNKVIIKREAPMLIADNDVACPYCKNSRPAIRWIKNSLAEELIDPPAEIKKLRARDESTQIDDYPLEEYWCPICRRHVEAHLLLQKGDEWKEEFLKDVEVPDSISPLFKKEIREWEEEERKSEEEDRKWAEERGPSLQDRINNPKRPVLTFDPSIVQNNVHQGLMVKTLVHVRTKTKDINKVKWLRVGAGLQPDSMDCNVQATTYLHSEKERMLYERNYRDIFPLRYLPIREIKEIRHTFGGFYLGDKETRDIEESMIVKYHAGEPLPLVCIMSSDMSVLNNPGIVAFACDMGFSHVPVIFVGHPEEKKEMEDKFKDSTIIGDTNFNTDCDEVMPIEVLKKRACLESS